MTPIDFIPSSADMSRLLDDRRRAYREELERKNAEYRRNTPEELLDRGITFGSFAPCDPDIVRYCSEPAGDHYLLLNCYGDECTLSIETLEDSLELATFQSIEAALPAIDKALELIAILAEVQTPDAEKESGQKLGEWVFGK